MKFNRILAAQLAKAAASNGASKLFKSTVQAHAESSRAATKAEMFSKMLQAKGNAYRAEIESQKTAMVSILKSNGVMFRKSAAATSGATEG